MMNLLYSFDELLWSDWMV